REARLVSGAPDIGADVCDVVLVEIDDEQQRLRREKLKAAQSLQILTGELQRTQWRSMFERVLAALDEIAFLVEFRGLALLQVFLDALQSALRDAEVREDQFVLHRLRVA